MHDGTAWIEDRQGPVRVCFSGQLPWSLSGGEGSVAQPRPIYSSEAVAEALAAGLGANPAPQSIATNHQVHSNRVVDVAEAPAEADGLVAEVAQLSGQGLAVFTADCVPVLLAVPGQAVAAVHAGWRGLAAGIVPAGVAALQETAAGSGLRAQVGTSAITAWIGPSVGPCCYEVSDDVAIAVAERSGMGVVVGRDRGTVCASSRPHLDLVAAAAAQLERTGVEDIRRLGPCTRCDRRWHSFRRDGSRSGRNYGVIWVGAETDPSG